MAKYVKKGFTENDSFIDSRIEKLNELYVKIDALKEDTPHSLARKVTLYNAAQGIIGDLYAQAVYDHGIAYINRKNAQAIAELNFNGTGKDKESYATIQTKQLRILEAEAEAEKAKWENAFKYTEKLADAIKHELKVIFYDYGNGGRPN